MFTDFSDVNECSIVDLLGPQCIKEIVQRFERITNLGVAIETCTGELGTTDVTKLLRRESVSLAGCLPFYVTLFQTSTSAAVTAKYIDDALILIVDHLTLYIRQAAPSSCDFDVPLRLKDILEDSPTPMGWSNIITGEIEYVNRAFERMFGYQRKEIKTLDAWFNNAFPDPEYRAKVLKPWQDQALKCRHTRQKVDSIEVEVVCKNGTVRKTLLSATWLGNRRLVNYTDMTDHWRVQSRLTAQNQMLQMVATGQSLTVAIEHIVHQVQSESKDALCSVLLVDEQDRLRTCAAPSLPQFYLDAIEGLKIGPAVGSCGTAAFHKRRVIVENIAEHDYWQGYTELAEKTGIAACWSDPILASNGDLLGTFAIYHPYPARPSTSDIELITFASHLASMAIENHRIREALEARAYYDDLTGLANRGRFFDYAECLLSEHETTGNVFSMVMIDLDHFKQINDQYGHKVGDSVLQAVANIMLERHRSGCKVGRIGGEEFGIMLADTNLDQAYQIATALCQAVAQNTVFDETQRPIQVTISAGVAQCEMGAVDSIDRLFGRADEALYQAKAAGRNQVVKYLSVSAKE